MKFNKINNRYNGPALEEEVLAFWDENAVFDRTLEQSSNRPLFTFNEGPPTANGKPGIHHVLHVNQLGNGPKFCDECQCS